MLNNVRRFIHLAALALALVPAMANAQDAQTTIRSTIEEYMRSIDAADPEMASKLWLTTPEVSFIHPLGHEKGWDEIKKNFYGTVMGAKLKDRHLKLVGDPTIRIYGNSAVVEFYWDFVATIRETGQPIHTTGRETQVYERIPASGWRIVHIHYSRPPVTELSQGL